jgi:ribA/ribD-fused uncharacterized protein
MKYNLEWLLARYEQGEPLKFLFFWGHQPKKDGSVGDSCFSQWWLADFTVEGQTYRTAEHWMLAEKARLFGDSEIREKIIRSKAPAEAKKLGRAVKNFDPTLWDAHKYDIVRTGNGHKFSQYPDLRRYLLQTGNRILVEASPVDPIWGIGLAKDDERAANPTQWKGENLLGFALMEVRDALSVS